jgi:hypothetical protein
MVLPEFLILFRDGKVARFNLVNLPTRVVVQGADGKHETVWDPDEPDVYQF